ncbi:DUF4429 domain-containing protein [Streptomyces sp. DT24]|uniref:DUF4429 domain-containing protein n=1 Tax=unclassified Streptomyces TaxID=2593676 RepID=UPI0023B97566|nr:DUF4429 domain-containing protein [Streptomyces sp. AM 4-1-1]WEH33194.1 DUF4429 domain-containing protein [Streptomyces sp. AM 4-1-1]
MGDVLAGIHATWEFDTDSVLIRFERGIRAPKLFQSLRERRVPHAALSSVTLTPGKRGTVVLRAVPRPGADPLLEAAAGQLDDSRDPYRLVLPAAREPLAEYYAGELRAALGPGSAFPAERFLVAAPEAPMHFKAYDGRAEFDGSLVSFRWSRTGASSAKWKAGDQTFPVTELCGVEWRSPEVFNGHLRLVRPGTDPAHLGAAGPGAFAQADQDPAAVVFGLGYGPVHESLPFAAAVLQSVRTTQTVRVPQAVRVSQPASLVAAAVPAGAGRRDPAEIAERIRHLGDLYEAGLVTDAEFTAKKAQLLDEL